MKTYFRLCIAVLVTMTSLTMCKKTETIIQEAVPNYADSVKRNLWGYYPLNGNMSDSSGRNHQMVGMNGIGFGTDRSGTASSALLFDGVNDFAVIDSGKVFPQGDFTVSFWMNPQKTTGGRIFNKANYADATSPTVNFGFDDDFASNKLSFSISKDNNVCGSVWYAGSNTYIMPNTIFTPNSWYHIAAEHVNGVEKIYMNGQLIAANTTPNLSAKACSNAPWYFGIWWTGGMYPYKGTLDNIRIYTRGLSDNEVKYLFENYK